MSTPTINLFTSIYEGVDGNAIVHAYTTLTEPYSSDILVLSQISLFDSYTQTDIAPALYITAGDVMSDTFTEWYVSPFVYTTNIPFSSVNQQITVNSLQEVIEFNVAGESVPCLLDINVLNISWSAPALTPTATPSATLEPTPTSSPAVTPTPSATQPAAITVEPVTVAAGITVNDLLAQATTLTGSQTINSTVSSFKTYIYEIKNTSADILYAVTEFYNTFNGSVEVYNGKDVVVTSFNIANGSTTTESYQMYNVLPEYYSDIYKSPVGSFPTEVDYLDSINMQTESGGRVVFKTFIAANTSAYIVVNGEPAYFSLINRTKILSVDAIPFGPTEPETTNPQLNQIITVAAASGEYDFTVPQEIINSFDGSPLKIIVSGDTNKVIQAVVSYGPHIRKSEYFYNPFTVTDLQRLTEDLAYVTRDPDVVLRPFPSADVDFTNTTTQSSPIYDSLYSIIDIDIAAIEGAKVDVKINLPLENSNFQMKITSDTASSDPLPYYDFRSRDGESGESVRRRLWHMGYNV